jgi:hypothetical protein
MPGQTQRQTQVLAWPLQHLTLQDTSNYLMGEHRMGRTEHVVCHWHLLIKELVDNFLILHLLPQIKGIFSILGMLA